MELISIHNDSQKMGKTFLRLTNKCTELFFSNSEQPTNTIQSDPSDLNPKVDGVFTENVQKTEKLASDSNPDTFGLKSELYIKEKEYTLKENIKEEQNFSFISVDYLKSLPEDNTPIDLDGRRGVLKNYNSLMKLPWEDIQLETKSETARACEPYAKAVREIMNEKYELEQVIANQEDDSY